MSIKQLGGVFGRNPTFNDVTIEGQLTFDGDIDINSDLKVDGNLEVTGNTSTDKITATGTYQNPLAVFNSTSGYSRIVFQENGTAKQYLQTLNGADGLKLMNGDGTTEVMRSQSNNISIANGNLIIGTSGKGIDFSATAGTGTSELLDDYEEGDWTPTITGSSSNPTVTYGLQRGVYSKVGRLVTATAYFSWSAFSGGSGDCYISGLPFVIEGAVGAGAAAAISQLDGVTFTVNRDNFGLFGSPSTSTLKFTCYGSATTTDSIPTTSIAASGLMVLTISYQS
jgi:hypothetical protein